jgi:hypothetical protein
MATQAMTSVPALFGRLSWMMIGPFALAICALSITERRAGWFGPLDVVYFAVLGGMLLGRWLEFRYSLPRTATGEPATAAHLRRYAWVLGVLGFGGWVAANLIGSQSLLILG